MTIKQGGTSHSLVDSTPVCQVIANLTKVAADLSKRMTLLNMVFRLVDNLASAMKGTESDATAHAAFAFTVQDSKLMNSFEDLKDRIDNYQPKKGEKWLCFDVTAPGNGMDPEQLRGMLLSYKEADTSSKTKNVANARLSLFLCIELCRRQGGFFACASTPFDSTVFHFGIPVLVLTEEGPTHEWTIRLSKWVILLSYRVPS